MSLEFPQVRSAQQQQQLRKLPTSSDVQTIWYIIGPAGCGKSTVATYIATALNIPLVEGDFVS